MAVANRDSLGRLLPGHKETPSGSLSRQWKGDNASYFSKHEWIRKQFGSPPCEDCGKSTGWIEWANVSGDYRRVRYDWKRLCRPCHARFDGIVRTHCVNGHEFTVENTYRRPDKGTKQCITCKGEAKKRFEERNAA